MKRLLLIFALCSFTSLVKAQTYVPMPTASDNAIWTVYVYGKEAGCWNYDLFTNGDTTINNYNYVVLGYRGEYLPWYSTGIGSGYCSNVGSNGIPGGVWLQRKRFAYREDSLHRVYFRKFDPWQPDTNEILLFDFSLQIGDSLKGFFNDAMFEPYGGDPRVSSIDSVLIDNNWRKKINFKGHNNEECFYFIEGIGSNYGFKDWTMCPFFESSVELNCHTVNDSLIYPLNTVNCQNFSYITNNKEIIPGNTVIFIYPNPAQDYISINLPSNYSATRLSIYNLSGQLISQQLITSTQIPITDLDNGMYIFEFGNGDKILGRQRVVVAR